MSIQKHNVGTFDEAVLVTLVRIIVLLSTSEKSLICTNPDNRRLPRSENPSDALRVFGDVISVICAKRPH